MKIQLRIATVVALLAAFTSTVQAQTNVTPKQKATTTHSKRSHKPAQPSLAEQVKEMREQFQTELDDLKAKLAARDAQIDALQTNQQSALHAAENAEAKSQATASQVQENAAAVTSVQSSYNDLKTQAESVTASIQQVQKTADKIQRSIDEPVALHYRGVTITPGGFLAGEAIWRQRALNSDIYTNYNATPFPGAGEAHTSEFVPTARQSRPNVLIAGKIPFGTLAGFLEGDFLAAGSSSNNLQSNSYAFRIRQGWGQFSTGHVKFTGGQMWTLLTEDKKSADPGQEAIPLTYDNNPHVGFTWVRQPGFRMEYAITPKLTAAASLENSQYQFLASNATNNFFFGSAGAAPGLNNPLANYTDQVAPDVIAKLTFDPGRGHFELGGIARFFRDRYYPNGTSASAQNDTKLGGGFVASAKYPVLKKLDVGVHLTAGDGTGRYGASLLPDITVHPNGTLAVLRNAQGLFSLEAHPNKNLDLFGYAGTEYVQRDYYLGPTGKLVGYAPPTASNVGCFAESTPTAETGYAPGVGACVGATRDVAEGTLGWAYRFYNGPAGKLQYGFAYSYLTREAWTGVGGAPKATNNLVYTSFRYFIP